MVAMINIRAKNILIKKQLVIIEKILFKTNFFRKKINTRFFEFASLPCQNQQENLIFLFYYQSLFV